MVNDHIPLETWSKNGETTFLLPHRNDLKNDNTRILYNYTYQVRLLIIFLTFSLLISTFVISVVSFWTLDSSDSDPPAQSVYATHEIKSNSTSSKDNDFIKQCAPFESCDSSGEYRTITGTCNNLNNPTWGSSNTPFIRLVGAHYSDGISKLRMSSDGKSLPSAREIQVRVFLNKQTNIPDKNNQLLMQWGQFVAQDVSILEIDNNDEDCCLYENQRWVSRACEAIIKIPVDDPVYSKYNKTCMRFTRAMTSSNYSFLLQPPDPSTFVNDATHYIDGSQIYGSDNYTASTRRSYTGGTLKSVLGADGLQEFCPYSSISGNSSRANTNLGMSLFHDMFLRFHNFVASKLKHTVPLWSDETLYQESRKIVGAVIQHVTYTQFLPSILGKTYTEDQVLAEDDGYVATVNPSTSQEFSAGAFRVLHNMVPAQHRFVDSKYTTLQTVNITDWVDRPYLLQQSSNFDDLLRGLLYTEGRLSQPSYNPLISNLMFHPNNSVGVDLLSYDIQRGRDTGLPPYNKIRELCGLPVAESFADLIDVIPSDNIYDLEKLYSSVDDVDFLVGALLETPETDALVGNTSRCVIGDFFRRSRVGDRYFYDNEKQPRQFPKDQLEVIKSISLNHIICATSSVDNLQKHIFTKVDNGWYSSMKWTCSQKYSIDFKPWGRMFTKIR